MIALVGGSLVSCELCAITLLELTECEKEWEGLRNRNERRSQPLLDSGLKVTCLKLERCECV